LENSNFNLITIFKFYVIEFDKIGECKSGGVSMGKAKKDPSKSKLGSPNVEGQGTTNTETGNVAASSSRHWKKQP
jgi:hypothetical protein